MLTGYGGYGMGRGMGHAGPGFGQGFQNNYYGPGPGPSYDQGYYGDNRPGTSNKKKASVEDEVEKYYHEELIEKLMKVKGVSEIILIFRLNLFVLE